MGSACRVDPVSASGGPPSTRAARRRTPAGVRRKALIGSAEGTRVLRAADRRQTAGPRADQHRDGSPERFGGVQDPRGTRASIDGGRGGDGPRKRFARVRPLRAGAPSASLQRRGWRSAPFRRSRPARCRPKDDQRLDGAVPAPSRCAELTMHLDGAPQVRAQPSPEIPLSRVEHARSPQNGDAAQARPATARSSGDKRSTAAREHRLIPAIAMPVLGRAQEICCRCMGSGRQASNRLHEWIRCGKILYSGLHKNMANIITNIDCGDIIRA